ncbi:MAG: rod shape-determining protein RodA [Lachnospiraceae bacterium]|nr:rod shape-determining protein RodA [Candidatus Colinaster equi]
MLRQYKLQSYNFKLIILVLALSIIGYFAIGSAKESVQDRQLYGIIVGFVLMIFISLIDYNLLDNIKWIIYIGNIVLLLAVLLFGVKVNGSTRWINIGFQFQPSELAKILLILFFSQFIMKYKERLNTVKMLACSIGLVAVPLGLVYLEPDLSTSIMFVVTFFVMLFIGGLDYKIVLALFGTIVPLGVVFFSIILQDGQTLLHGYQITRILAWLDPEKYADSAAYQQLNSITAIGSGQFIGKGLDNNVIASVKNGNFISEPQTDFIFAVIGEELGFIGAAAVIILLVLIAFECMRIARLSRNLSGAIIADGMAALISIQGFMNIAVATGLLPNTGIPLPFVSYGLTSLVSLYIGIGVVLNVGLQANKRANMIDN